MTRTVWGGCIQLRGCCRPFPPAVAAVLRCSSHHPLLAALLAPVMDERIGLTRHVAARMLSTKPWRLLLHSPASRAASVQRLHNIVTLFPELLRERQHRDLVYSLVDVIAPLLSPQSLPAADAEPAALLTASSPLLFELYVSALAARILQLLPYFTAPQQMHVAQGLTPHTDRTSSHLSSSLASVRSAFLAQQPFTALHLSPHCLAFPSSQHLNRALHSPAFSSPFPSTSSSPVDLPLSHLPRQRCPTCSAVQPFYCTRCYRLVHPLAAAILPAVRLPFALHIVMHPRFDRTKSTALHCRLLCPDGDVHLHTWPQLPLFSDSATYILWPDEHAVDVSHLPNLPPLPPSPPHSVDTAPSTSPSATIAIVLLEGTWEQAAEMRRRSARLASLPSVRLSDGRTSFWRWQDKGAAHLSSIEAVYQTAVQWPRPHQAQPTHEFDDLLWLFALGWQRMRDYYAQHPQLLTPVSHSGCEPVKAAVAIEAPP